MRDDKISKNALDMVKQEAKGAEIFSLKWTEFETANTRLTLDFENKPSSSKLFFGNECHYLKSPFCTDWHRVPV